MVEDEICKNRDQNARFMSKLIGFLVWLGQKIQVLVTEINSKLSEREEISIRTRKLVQLELSSKITSH